MFIWPLPTINSRDINYRYDGFGNEIKFIIFRLIKCMSTLEHDVTPMAMSFVSQWSANVLWPILLIPYNSSSTFPKF